MAALLVFWHHIGRHACEVGLLDPTGPAGFCVGVGQFGVDLFFMISGYLIFSTLQRRRGTGSFLIRRFIRIVPLLWVTNTMLLIVTLRMQGPSWAAFVTFVQSDLMLPGMLNLSLVQPNLWSLSYEETFYGLTALLFALSAVRRKVAIAAAGAIALALVVIHPRFVFFLVGIAALQWPVTVPWAPAWIGLLLTLLGGAFLNADSICDGLEEVHPIFLASVPVAYLAFSGVVRGSAGFQRVLRSAPMQGIGLTSYSFYLWQDPVLSMLWDYWPVRSGIGFVGYALTALVVLTGVSFLSFRVIEQDGAVFLRRYLLGEEPSGT